MFRNLVSQLQQTNRWIFTIRFLFIYLSSLLDVVMLKLISLSINSKMCITNTYTHTYMIGHTGCANMSGSVCGVGSTNLYLACLLVVIPLSIYPSFHPPVHLLIEIHISSVYLMNLYAPIFYLVLHTSPSVHTFFFPFFCAF